MRWKNGCVSGNDQASRVCSSFPRDQQNAWKRNRLARIVLVWCSAAFLVVGALNAEEPTYHAFGNPNLDAEGRMAVWRYQAKIVERWRLSGKSINSSICWKNQWEDDWDRAFDDLEERWRRFKDPAIKKTIGAFLAELMRSKDVKRAFAAMAAVGTLEIIEKAETAWKCWGLIEELELCEQEIKFWEDVIEWRQCMDWEPILEKRGLI